jgi:hypothetical protein
MVQVVGAKQNKQAQNKADRPDTIASLPDLSACLPCQWGSFVLCLLLALVLQSVFFAVAPNSTNKVKQARQYAPLSILFNMMSMDESNEM